VSEGILPLLSEVVWVNADRMLDTKLISVFFVDEFKSAISTVPLWIATDFECETFVVLEAVSVFKHITDAEFECALVLAPLERVEIIADEAVQLVAIITIPPIPRRRWVLGHCRIVTVVSIKELEERPPGLAVFPGDLLARRFTKEWCVLVVQVSIFGVPYVPIFVEILLPTPIGELVPEWGVGGQPVEQTVPIPVTDRFSSVRVRSLWPVAHTQK